MRLKKNYTSLLHVIAYFIMSSGLYAQTAAFTVSDSVGCAPLSVSFFNSSTGADTYYWDFGNALNSTLTQPVHIYYSPGIYTVTLYAYDSLMNADSVQMLITVPGKKPFFSTESEACPGKSIQFAVYGNYDPTNIILWDFQDGFTSNSSFVEHAFIDTGTYNVILTVTNTACGTMVDSNLIAITNNVIPQVHIHPENADTVICLGENFPFFYDESLPVFWDFGDGNTSTDPYPIHIYDSTGTYTAIITVTNACGNTNTIDTNIVVSSGAVPNVSLYSSKSTICPGQELAFLATLGSGYIYYWDFGDGNSDTTRVTSNSFADTGEYTVTVVVTNLCGNNDSAFKIITVTDSLVPNGSLYASSHYACQGEEITLIGSSGYNSYYWNFGDGDTSTSRSVKHIYTDTGSYYVSLTITNECGNSVTYYDTIKIDNSLIPLANFYLDQNSYCAGDNIQFNANGGPDITDYYWEFGDSFSDTVKSPMHTYADTGNYNVMLVVFNLCGNSDTLNRTITLDTTASALASFSYYTIGNLCTNAQLYFTNASSDTNNCVWMFGDGDSSFSANPTHSYSNAGNYLVQLTVTNGCGKSSISIAQITVSPITTLAAPNVSCTQSTDTIIFSWGPITNAQGYEISIDSGTTWSSHLDSNLIYKAQGDSGSTFSLMVRTLGNDNCTNGDTSQNSICTIVITGIKENSYSSDFTIYPNPTTGFITINTKQIAPSQNNSIKIYDVTGKLIEILPAKNGTALKYNIGYLDNGVYFLKPGESSYQLKKIVLLK